MSPTTRLVYRVIIAAIAWVAATYTIARLDRHHPTRHPIRLYFTVLAVLVAIYRTLVVTEPWMPASVAVWFRAGDISAFMWLLVVVGLVILPRTWRQP
jgi:hypothetical protein